jgi:DNA repair protein RadC
LQENVPVDSRHDESERLQRYETVVDRLTAHHEFVLAHVKGACPAVTSLSVTRIVRQLEDDGYLRQEGPKAHGKFLWTEKRDEFSPRAWIESKVFGNRVTRAPLTDRPRERLLAEGPAALRIADLLAILIRSGRPGESATQAGEKLAARYSDRIEELADAGRGELKAISPAVAETAYCQIMAGIELGRRIERAAQETKTKDTVRIRSAADAISFCQASFRRLADEGTQEEFHMLSLDTKNQVIRQHLVSLGLVGESLIAPREVFRPAIRDAAAGVILVHNHPSGDPTPSPEDIAATERLEEAAQTIGIKLVDHIIVARQGCVSIREYECQ